MLFLVPGRSAPAAVALLLVLAAGVAALLSACGEAGQAESGARASAHDGAPLLVLAAADLQAALPEIAARYEADFGRRVDVVLGSTGNLTTQIENGAPGDLFLAANQSFVDRLAARGLIAPETRRVYAIGPLVLVSATGVPLPQEIADLAQPMYGTVAIANPEHAPYGLAAREALQSAGVWEQVRPKLVFGENIAQVLQFVRTGNADAGIVALGLVVQLPGAEYRLVDAALHTPLRQTAAVLRGSPRPEEARAFLELVMSETGQAILRRYGFLPPDSL